jgi:hypothetical protein
MIQAGRSLTLWTTNLPDTAPSPTNLNVWSVGAQSGGGSFDSGFNMPIKPLSGNLLGATVTNIAPPNKQIYNVWAGTNFGLSPAGYTNNVALGHLIIDRLITNSSVGFVFNGVGISNALYIDLLELKDGATAEANSTLGSHTNNYNFPWLQINTNMVVYYARAVEDDGTQVIDDTEAIDNASKQGGNSTGRLRWVYSYAGYYSSTNLYFTNMDGSVITNTVNIDLAQSADIDSDSDGKPNGSDPTPFFEPSEVKFMAGGVKVTNTVSHQVAQAVKIQWTTIPNATNYVFYTTNIFATNWPPASLTASGSPANWVAFTNFVNPNYWTNSYFGANRPNPNLPVANTFLSPQVYIDNPTLPDNSQQTNVWVYDAVTNVPHYYKVIVSPWVNFQP